MMATWEDIRAVALTLPGVRETQSMGEPCFKFGRRGVVHLWGKRALMKLDPGRQELLFEVRPDVFEPFTAGAMRWSLVEIEALEADEIGELVREAWRCVVPKKVSRASVPAA
ncbi:MAG: MmcQ/YjbR family DNA-binding protein [Phenylobacterium sp.]